MLCLYLVLFVLFFGCVLYKGGVKMAKTKKPNREEIRSTSITVPLSIAEKNKIVQKAEEVGLPMSSFVRFVLIDFMRRG